MVRRFPWLCAALALAAIAPRQGAARAEAPYEHIPAPDFTRGERGAVHEFSIGVYSHYRRFDVPVSGTKRVVNSSDIHDVRFIPVEIIDYRFSERFAVSIKQHNAVIRTSQLDRDGATRRLSEVAMPGDVFLYGIFHPWLGGSNNHEYSLWDRRNLGFVAGPKIDLGHEDPQLGTSPGADFRHAPFGPGSNEALAGFVYTGHVNDKVWLYHYSQFILPLDRTRSGFRPGARYESQFLGVSWLPNDAVQLFCSANLGYERPGHNGLPGEAANSGGTKVFLNPGITADFAHGYGTEIAVNLPVYGNLRGTQLEGHEDLFFGFYKVF